MRSRLPIGFWLPMGALMSLMLWFGCEQKGDISPVTSGQGELKFLDTVIVDPAVLSPQGVAIIDAYVVNENAEPAPGEEVRFRVNRGLFENSSVETTITTDNYGRARTNYTAPPDTGSVDVLTELLSMSVMTTTRMRVESTGATLGGLLSADASEDTLFADNGASSTTIHARLRNEQNNPVPDATISFSTTAGLITSPAVTNASGVATATLTSTVYIGTAMVIATYNSTKDTVYVEFLEPYPAGLVEVIAANSQMTAGSDSTLVTASVYAENDSPIQDNTTVAFAASGGHLSNVTGLTVGGEVSTWLHAPTATGNVTVTATAGTVSGNVSVQVTPGAVATITVSSDDESLVADNASETQVSAYVVDEFGNPVSQGTPIGFSAMGGTITEQASVNSQGYAVAEFRAGLMTGPAVVIASNSGVQGSATIELLASTPASINLSINPPLLTADGYSTATLRAQVLDANSSPVSDGTEVVFTSELGEISLGAPVASVRKGDSKGSRGSFEQSSISWNAAAGRTKSINKERASTRFEYPTNAVLTVTTVNGFATATLTSSTQAGEDMITAAAGSVSDDASINYSAGSASSIQVTPSVGELPADGVSSTTVTCRVVDTYGNVLGGGVPVNVSATIGSVLPTSGFTNASGIFITNLITTRTQGNCAIIASSDQASGYGEVTFSAPQAEGIVLNATPNWVLADGVSSTIVSVYVSDEHGLPVEGADVEWSADAGPGELVPISDDTDEDGIASAHFFGGASATDVTQVVHATVGEFTQQKTITMRGVTIESSINVTSLPADGESTAQVQCVLRETTSGLAIPAASVRFAASSGSIQQYAVTNEAGIASATYNAGTTSGDATITCTYGDTLRSQTSLNLTNTEADELIVEIADAELLANGVSTTVVTATVMNEGGQTVGNTAVAFTSLGSGYFSPASVITNAQGVASSVFHSVAMAEDEETTIDVAIERTNIERQIMQRGVSMQLTSQASSMPANGAATTTITVRLRQTTSYVGIGGAGVLFGSNIGLINSSVVTDSTGTAMLTFTASDEIGMAEIIARYGNLITDTLYINMFAPSAAVIDLSTEDASILANGSDLSELSTLITDQVGTPISGVAVAWSLSGAGTLLSGMTLSNAQGIATNYYRGPASVSDQSAMVRCQSASAMDSVAIESRGVTVNVTTAISQLPANGVSSVSVQCQLRETTSLVGVANATVNFGTSLGYMPSSLLTNASGVISTTLTAGDVVGVAQVIARYGNLLTDTAMVNFYSPTPASVELETEATSLRADGISETEVFAYIYDELNVPLVNADVTWTAEGMNFEPEMTTTNFAGVASIPFISGAFNSDQVVTLTASADDAEASVNILLRGVTVSVGAVPEMVIADGSSSSMISVHVYETTSQVGVAEVPVTFGTNRGMIASSAVTNAAGVASAVLTSSTQTGTATVTASYGAMLSSQTSVLFAESTPTTLSLTASPTILLADNASNSTLTAVLTDQNGNPVSNGTQVRFSIPPQSGSLENLRTTVSGVAQNVLTSSSTPDTVLIIAWAEENPNVRDSVQVIYTVGPPAVVTMGALSDSLRADGIETDSITATVTDAVGHLLPNVEVQFVSSIGNITSSKTTNSQGRATVPFSSSQTGTAQLTASAGSAQGHYTLYLIPGEPNSILLTYFPGSVGVRGSGRNETLLVTAQVLDANNNPVIDGTEVYFNINNSPGGGDFLSSTDAIPTINGNATVSYNSGTVSGTARIRAVCDGISAVSTEILVYAGPPYIEDVNDGCATSHMSLGASPCNMFGMDIVGDSVRITALVGDRYNNPVTPGTAVYFTTSGGVITTATGYTDSSGFARVTLYSGNPLPTINRWLNTIPDPNLGTPILCSNVPDQNGMAKVMARSAGVDASGDSVQVWASTNVVFDYSQPLLALREVTVNGDPSEREMYIGENAIIRFALNDWNYWPMVAGTEVRFSATAGNVYPSSFEVACPGDTSYTISFFNSLTLSDDDAATPVLIEVEATYGTAYTFTETFTLRASLPPGP